MNMCSNLTVVKDPAVQPRRLKGFRDVAGSEAATRDAALRDLREELTACGFAAVCTPALEYAEVLLAKSADDADSNKQMYRFRDGGNRDVGLRYDLTVPLARFVAMNRNKLDLPLKVHQIGSVWRAEKPQAGRFREFVQCDFDIVGSEDRLSDAVVLATAHKALTRSSGAGFTIRVGHRALLVSLIRSAGIPEPNMAATLRAVDRLGRSDPQQTADRVAQLNPDTPRRAIDAVVAVITATTPVDSLGRGDFLNGLDPAGQTAARDLQEVLELTHELGTPKECCVADLRIVRGLDYYTAMVFETFLDDAPELGSVCSGGRYDSLLAAYGEPGVGAVGGSVGVDRLLTRQGAAATMPAASVLVVRCGNRSAADAARLYRELIDAGCSAELDLQTRNPKTLGKLYARAQHAGTLLVVVLQGDNSASVRKLSDRSTLRLMGETSEIVDEVIDLLANSR